MTNPTEIEDRQARIMALDAEYRVLSGRVTAARAAIWQHAAGTPERAEAADEYRQVFTERQRVLRTLLRLRSEDAWKTVLEEAV